MRCKNHPEEVAARRCRHCTALLCEACYDPVPDGCREDCRPTIPKRGGAAPGNRTWLKVVVSILAILGAVTLLLATICAGMLVFYSY